MRSAPPLQVKLVHFGVWRAMVALLGFAACASMVAWWWAQQQPSTLSVVAVCGVLASLACTVMLWRMPPQTLRWDRQRWHVARHGVPEQAGELSVAVDLGAWILLRFRPDAALAGPAWRGRRGVWIALQRQGLEAQWHALRCALFAARPVSRGGNEASSPEAHGA